MALTELVNNEVLRKMNKKPKGIKYIDIEDLKTNELNKKIFTCQN